VELHIWLPNVPRDCRNITSNGDLKELSQTTYSNGGDCKLSSDEIVAAEE
jgi:hypothetical protein